MFKVSPNNIRHNIRHNIRQLLIKLFIVKQINIGHNIGQVILDKVGMAGNVNQGYNEKKLEFTIKEDGFHVSAPYLTWK